MGIGSGHGGRICRKFGAEEVLVFGLWLVEPCGRTFGCRGFGILGPRKDTI